MWRSARFLAMGFGGVAALALAGWAQSTQTPNTLKLDKPDGGPRAKIADMAWLAGRWVGEGLGGQTEEVWSPPMGDSMMGMYRLVKDGKIVFSELLFIVEEAGSLTLKLKHFDAAFVGWEEKDKHLSFPLVKLSPNEAYFDGITFRKLPDGTLEAFVAIKQKDGAVKEEAFRYKAVK